MCYDKIMCTIQVIDSILFRFSHRNAPKVHEALKFVWLSVLTQEKIFMLNFQLACSLLP